MHFVQKYFGFFFFFYIIVTLKLKGITVHTHLWLTAAITITAGLIKSNETYKPQTLNEHLKINLQWVKKKKKKLKQSF